MGVARGGGGGECEAMRARRTRPAPFRMMENGPVPAFDEVICIAATTCAFSHEERAPITPRKIRVKPWKLEQRATLLYSLHGNIAVLPQIASNLFHGLRIIPLPAQFPKAIRKDKKTGQAKETTAEGEWCRAIMK